MPVSFMISHVLPHMCFKKQELFLLSKHSCLNFFLIFFNYVYTYDQVWVCASEHRCPETRGIRFPGAGIKGGCVLCAMDVGVGNQIQSSGSTL